jgi:hypothetical protein
LRDEEEEEEKEDLFVIIQIWWGLLSEEGSEWKRGELTRRHGGGSNVNSHLLLADLSLSLSRSSSSHSALE